MDEKKVSAVEPASTSKVEQASVLQQRRQFESSSWNALVDGAKKMKEGEVKDFVVELLNQKFIAALSDAEKKGNLKAFVEMYNAKKDSPYISADNKTKMNDLYVAHISFLNNPHISLDEGIASYLTAVKVFTEQKNKIEALFKVMISEQIKGITQENVFTRSRDFLLIKLCVKFLKDDALTEEYQKKKEALGTEGALHALVSIEKSDAPVFEKAQKTHAVLANYFSLNTGNIIGNIKANIKGNIPESLRAYIGKYQNEIIEALNRRAAFRWRNVNLDKMFFHLAFRGTDEEEAMYRRAPGTDPQSKKITGAFDDLSRCIVRMVVTAGDMNASLLCANDWIEIAARTLLSGNIEDAQAIYSALRNASLMRITDRVTEPYLSILDKLHEVFEPQGSMLKPAEIVAERNEKTVIPILAYRSQAMTKFAEGNPAKTLYMEGGKKVIADTKFLYFNSMLDELRAFQAQRAIQESTAVEDETIFGALAKPLSEAAADMYKVEVDEENVKTSAELDKKDWSERKHKKTVTTKSAMDSVKEAVKAVTVKSATDSEKEADTAPSPTKTDSDLGAALVKMRALKAPSEPEKKVEEAAKLNVEEAQKRKAEEDAKKVEEDTKRGENLLYNQAYNAYLKQNRFSAKGFENSLPSADYKLKLDSYRTYVEKTGDTTLEGFRRSPQYEVYESNRADYYSYDESKRSSFSTRTSSATTAPSSASSSLRASVEEREPVPPKVSAVTKKSKETPVNKWEKLMSETDDYLKQSARVSSRLDHRLKSKSTTASSRSAESTEEKPEESSATSPRTSPRRGSKSE